MNIDFDADEESIDFNEDAVTVSTEKYSVSSTVPSFANEDMSNN